MKEHEVNALNNFIGGWYIDPAICDNVIQYFNNSSKKNEGKVLLPGQKLEVKKDVKDSIDLAFPNLEESAEMDLYLNSLQNVLNLYLEKYPYAAANSRFQIVEYPQIQYYPPGGGYKVWHCERGQANGIATTRHLVFMTYLNDVSDNGGTEFYHQNFISKAEKGLTLIWPADWTFTHRGIPSKTEEKYITTGWFNYV